MKVLVLWFLTKRNTCLRKLLSFLYAKLPRHLRTVTEDVVYIKERPDLGIRISFSADLWIWSQWTAWANSVFWYRTASYILKINAKELWFQRVCPLIHPFLVLIKCIGILSHCVHTKILTFISFWIHSVKNRYATSLKSYPDNS